MRGGQLSLGIVRYYTKMLLNLNKENSSTPKIFKSVIKTEQDRDVNRRTKLTSVLV